MSLHQFVPMLSINTLKQITQKFTDELIQSSQGKSTSLSFNFTNMPSAPIIRKHQATYQSMVIGGTNFQKALVRRSPTGISLENILNLPLPKFSNSEEFYLFISSHLDDRADILTINLAYELDPFLRDLVLDGVLAFGGKENTFADLIGHQLGYEIENFLRLKHNREIIVALANDTLCLALSKLNQNQDSDSLVCGIVGTGLNFGLFVDENNFINLESGNFDKFVQSKIGEIIDQTSEVVGDSKFEKEVSGAYLYQHYNLIIDQLGEDAPHATSTDDLSIFASAGSAPHHLVAQQLLERSASLVACQIAGIYQFKNQPKLTFVMEGSLFWKAWQYKAMVSDYLAKLDIPTDSLHFTHVKNSSLIGSAQLALINAPHIYVPKEDDEKEEEEPEKPAEPAPEHH